MRPIHFPIAGAVIVVACFLLLQTATTLDQLWWLDRAFSIGYTIFMYGLGLCVGITVGISIAKARGEAP